MEISPSASFLPLIPGEKAHSVPAIQHHQHTATVVAGSTPPGASIIVPFRPPMLSLSTANSLNNTSMMTTNSSNSSRQHMTRAMQRALTTRKSVITSWPSVGDGTHSTDPTPTLLAKVRDYIAAHHVPELPLSEQWDHYLHVITIIMDGFRVYAPVLGTVRDYFVKMKKVLEEDARRHAEEQKNKEIARITWESERSMQELKMLHVRDLFSLTSQIDMLNKFRENYANQVDKDFQKAKQDFEHTKSVVMRAQDEAEQLRFTVSGLHDMNAELRLQNEQLRTQLTDEKRIARRAVASNPIMNLDFFSATQSELDSARLSTQKVLINHASEQYLVAKTLIDQQQMEIQRLRDRVEELENELEGWKRKVHETRCAIVPELGKAPPTPRPEWPYDLPNKHGIKVQHRTTREIAADVLHLLDTQTEQLRKNFNELRKLRRAVQWVDESILKRIYVEESNPSVLPYLKDADAAYCFLRIHRNDQMGPGINNEDWSAIKTCGFIFEIFTKVQSLMEIARHRYEMDKDHITLRIQREEVKDLRLQTFIPTTEQVNADVTLLPFDYIVSAYLMERDPSQFQQTGYNLVHHARRYQGEEPICALFLAALDNQLPHGVFAIIENLFLTLKSSIRLVDIEQSGKIAIATLKSLVLQFFLDQPGTVWCSIQRGIQFTISSTTLEYTGDFVTWAHLLDEESFDRPPTHLVREIRRHVISNYSEIYKALETAIGEVVFESPIQPDLLLVQVSNLKEIAKSVAGRPMRTWKGPPAILPLDEFMERVVQELPKYPRTHAPPPPETTTTNNTHHGNGAPSGKPKRRLSRRLSKATFGLEFVEWKYLLYRLRKTMIPFQDRVHTLECKTSDFALTSKESNRGVFKVTSLGNIDPSSPK
eukprot:PhF_6_TR40198/c0_g1_i1/m.59647